jgi:hypothetical protein
MKTSIINFLRYVSIGILLYSLVHLVLESIGFTQLFLSMELMFIILAVGVFFLLHFFIDYISRSRMVYRNNEVSDYFLISRLRVRYWLKPFFIYIMVMVFCVDLLEIRFRILPILAIVIAYIVQQFEKKKILEDLSSLDAEQKEDLWKRILFQDKW